MKIHLYDSDPRKHSEPEKYQFNHGSLSSAMININNCLQKSSNYAEPDDAEWVGIEDGLNVSFKYKDKKSFVISVWETANTLPYILLNQAKSTNQRLFGTSRQISKLWERYGFECPTIYNGCDSDFWHPSKEKDTNRFVFLHASASFVRSGLDLTIQAFEEAFGDSKDVVLIIKDTQMSLTLKRKIEEYISKGVNIEFLSERLTLQEMRDLYSSAHCAVTLQRSASFGLITPESMACGTYCLTGDIEPSNEIVNSSVASLVPLRSFIPIYGDMKYFVQDWGLLNTFGTFPYPEEPYFADFDVETYASKMKEIKANWNNYSKINVRKHIVDNWGWEKPAKRLVELLSK